MPSRGVATADGLLPGMSAVREGFAHGQMEQIQRGRLVAAMSRAASEQGVANITVAMVVEGAGVSRRTFYELFSDCEDCLLAALEGAVTRAGARVLPAYETAEGAWRGRMRAGLTELLGFFDEQPHLARLLIVEWLAAGPRALERRRRLLEVIASTVDEGRATRPGGSQPPELAAEGVVGAVASVLHARLTSTSPGALIELVNPLMGIVVLPYLGAAAARKELERPLPEIGASREDAAEPEDLLKGLNMRFTYRTMTVLAAVATHPGGSNRVIAQAAGVSDQGQISKLLMRLRKLGLVGNNGSPAKGEPNAWLLTARGERIERALRASADAPV
jgi:AcrR family transcriptional regulator